MQNKILKTEEDYNIALDRLEVIFDAEPATPEGDEAELLTLLIEKYENEHYPIPQPDPIAAIEYVMEETNMKPKDLVDILGNKGNVSKVLNKKRKLSIDMIRKLHENLQMPYDVLLKDYDLAL